MITMEAGVTQGGVGVVVCDRPHGWSLESTRFCAPNVVICEVFTNRKRTLIIGAYLPPSTLKNLLDLEEALTRFRDQYPIVLGDLNANIFQAKNPCSQQVANILMEFGLMELLH